MKPFTSLCGWRKPQTIFYFLDSSLAKLCFTVLLLSFSFTSIAQSKMPEQEAVRKAIEQETRLYIEGNYDKWATTWVHDPTSYWTYTAPDYNIEEIGWDNFAASMKQDMSGSQRFSAQEIALREKKSDYQYKIVGNLAHVIYRSGKGNLMTTTLEKQNGEWKIVNETDIATSSYNFKKSLVTLQSFIGKWKYVDGSYKTKSEQPADTNFRQMSIDYNIHETPYGIEFNSTNLYTYAGQSYTGLAKEDFISDNDKKIIGYFDYEKGANNISTTIGTASFDTSGRFVVKGMYDDKPTQVRFENIYSFTPDGLLHHEGRSYDDSGKLTYKWFFTLQRL